MNTLHNLTNYFDASDVETDEETDCVKPKEARAASMSKANDTRGASTNEVPDTSQDFEIADNMNKRAPMDKSDLPNAPEGVIKVRRSGEPALRKRYQEHMEEWEDLLSWKYYGDEKFMSEEQLLAKRVAKFQSWLKHMRD